MIKTKEEVALEEIQGRPRKLWQFGLSSFNKRDTKIGLIFAKNQHIKDFFCHKRPISYFQSQFSIPKTLRISLIFFT